MDVLMGIIRLVRLSHMILSMISTGFIRVLLIMIMGRGIRVVLDMGLVRSMEVVVMRKQAMISRVTAMISMNPVTTTILPAITTITTIPHPTTTQHPTTRFQAQLSPKSHIPTTIPLHILFPPNLRLTILR